MTQSVGSWHTLVGNPSDLETSREATRAGFLEQARTKLTRAVPFIDQGHALERAVQESPDLSALAQQQAIQSALLAAAGFSKKSRKYFSKSELAAMSAQVLEQIQAESRKTRPPDGGLTEQEVFARGVVDRYLLTTGDALGGQLRNWIGAQAQAQIVEALSAALANHEIQTERKPKTNKIVRIEWADRLLLFDVKPRFLDKNIDVILVKCPPGSTSGREMAEDPDNFLACGELKGGIDPAGADEHWKTAKSALDRIRNNTSFNGQPPALFFVGAAIDPTVAREVYDELTSGRLQYAANLTVQAQVEALTRWLVGL